MYLFCGDKSRVYYKDFTFLFNPKMKENYINYITYTRQYSENTVRGYNKILKKFE